MPSYSNEWECRTLDVGLQTIGSSQRSSGSDAREYKIKVFVGFFKDKVFILQIVNYVGAASLENDNTYVYGVS
jgi:hypothetical protein